MKNNFFVVTSLSLLLLSFYACKKEDNAGVVPPVVPPAGVVKTFYVSTATGDDSRTAEQTKKASTPWKTIQKAANSVPGGSTVIIAGGTYVEKVSIPTSCNGTPTERTVFRNKENESVVLDGKNTGSQYEGLFKLVGNEYVVVKGITVQNGYWYGFSGEGSKNITLDSCSTFNTRASGIYVKTSSEVTITRNNIRKACQELTRDSFGNGSQECISVVMVDGFKIANNEVWDTSQVGDAGGEGIDAKSGSNNGEIANNYVHDIARLGIYVDAGSKDQFNVRVHSNRVFNTGGMSVAGEIGGHVHEIYFYNNVVKDSKSSGLTFQAIGNGKYTNVYVVNNTFYNNALNGFAGDVGNYSKNTGNSNLVIRNNIFYNKISNSRFSIWHDLAQPHVISNNLYFDFKPSNNSSNSFNAAKLT
ncbi:MAG: right-handed parallel beta-helix repeat-containing protein, partial [Cytophagaceae bacterium]|nr:right-handed parallel beta-helix repeat-containing protein [Cytophagaceae bacterium]